ncbi:hypothetical protein [Amycolatopsis vancoresmycina]|nr:hypothetical protein [Amycolatopsis vancoresmycina]
MPAKNTSPEPAADAPPPEETAAPVETSGADSAPDAEPTPDPPAALEPGRYRFTGPYAQTYMSPPSFVAEPGETYDWPAGPPADGRWIKEN